jgi:hypothetical protein
MASFSSSDQKTFSGDLAMGMPARDNRRNLPYE